MSEQEWEWQQEHDEKMEVFDYGLCNSEILDEVISEIINDRLNDYYHEKVKPLELQLKKLGVPPDTQERKENGLNLLRYNPKDPFREQQKKGSLYSYDSNSDYYRFFEMLFEECLQLGWLKILDGATLYDTKSYWMWLFGCEENLNFLEKVEPKDEDVFGKDYTPQLLLEWKDKIGLCIYFLHVLMDKGYVTQAKNNEIIKAHFLPNSSTVSIANQRKRYAQNKNDEPKDYPKGHKTVLEIIDSCVSRTDE
jgi:hypothetical protein